MNISSSVVAQDVLFDLGIKNNLNIVNGAYKFVIIKQQVVYV